MSEKRKLKGILETIGVVVGSLAGAIIIITAATAKYDFSKAEKPKIVENNTQEDISPVAQVAVANDSVVVFLTIGFIQLISFKVVPDITSFHNGIIYVLPFNVNRDGGWNGCL